MYRPTDKKNNEWMGTNKTWRQLKLEAYFADIGSTDELLRKLYVEYKGEHYLNVDYSPPLHKVFPHLLQTQGIHTPDRTVHIEIGEPEGDYDCAYLAEFIKWALRCEDPEKRIRYKKANKRLLTILGGIGEGKTTLLDFFFRSYIKKNGDSERLVRINIDFAASGAITTSEFNSDYLTDRLLEKLADQFPQFGQDSDALLAVLKEPLSQKKSLLDLVERKSGKKAREAEEANLIKKFTEDHKVLVANIINYLANGQNKQVVVTFDNIDRLLGECQMKTPSLVQEMLNRWDCCSIVCMREYTYGNITRLGQTGFEQPPIYHKRPPRFGPILQKRFEKFPFEHYVDIPSFGFRGKTVEIRDVKRFVKNIAKFLWSDGIERALFRLSNGDIRVMFDMVKAFLCFHAVDMESLFIATFLRDRKEATRIGRLVKNYDNLVRAITVGNYRFYSSMSMASAAAQETFVLNIVGGPPEMPLLPYRVLTYIRYHENISKRALLDSASSIGMKTEVVEDLLGVFLKSYLIESMQGIDIQNVTDLVITRKGIYYFDELIVLAMYLENVMNDAWWDRPIEPYEQSFSIKQEAVFLEESIKYILRLEISEAEKVRDECLSIYQDFLDEKPYCERLCESVIAYLNGLGRRGAINPKKIVPAFYTVLQDISKAKSDGRLAYQGLPEEVHNELEKKMQSVVEAYQQLEHDFDDIDRRFIRCGCLERKLGDLERRVQKDESTRYLRWTIANLRAALNFNYTDQLDKANLILLGDTIEIITQKGAALSPDQCHDIRRQFLDSGLSLLPTSERAIKEFGNGGLTNEQR